MEDLEQLRIDAMFIANDAHQGQTRRDGKIPYIHHPKAVADHGSLRFDHEAQIVAWLHDVLEDTDVTRKDLEKHGFSERVIHAIVLLTKTKGEENVIYWNRIKKNDLARKVKIADMISNLADDPSERQIKKYAKGLHILTQ